MSVTAVKKPKIRKNMDLENYGFISKLTLFPTVFRIGCAHRAGFQ